MSRYSSLSQFFPCASILITRAASKSVQVKGGGLCTHYLLNAAAMKVNCLPFKMLHFKQKPHSGRSDSAFEIIMNLEEREELQPGDHCYLMKSVSLSLLLRCDY